MIACLSILLMSGWLAAADAADRLSLSVEARTLQQQLTQRLPASVRSWVSAETQRVVSDPHRSELQTRADAQAHFAPQPVLGFDLDALVFLVYYEALERLEWESHRSRPWRALGPKTEPSKKAAATNAMPTVTNITTQTPAGKREAAAQRDAVMAQRLEELARQLSPMGMSLLEGIR